MSAASRAQRRKDFAKVFQQLIGRYSPHQIWSDFVWMYACAISNSLPNPWRAKREETYMGIAGKYTRGELDLFAEMVGHLVNTIEISVSVENDYGDFLGELFMELNLGNAFGGQFFTPYNLCRMMAKVAWSDELLAERDRAGYFSVNDCACGGGAMLIAFAQECRERGINYQQDALFVGQDIDSTTALMCYIQLSLLGCAGYVHIGDTLSAPMTGPVLLGDNAETTWYTPMYFSDAWTLRQIREQNRLYAKARGERADEPAKAEPVQLAVSAKKKNAGQMMLDLG